MFYAINKSGNASQIWLQITESRFDMWVLLCYQLVNYYIHRYVPYITKRNKSICPASSHVFHFFALRIVTPCYFVLNGRRSYRWLNLEKYLIKRLSIVL